MATCEVSRLRGNWLPFGFKGHVVGKYVGGSFNQAQIRLPSPRETLEFYSRTQTSVQKAEMRQFLPHRGQESLLLFIFAF